MRLVVVMRLCDDEEIIRRCYGDIEPNESARVERNIESLMRVMESRPYLFVDLRQILDMPGWVVADMLTDALTAGAIRVLDNKYYKVRQCGH